MLLGVALGGLDDSMWLSNGGQATVTSYGGCLSKIPTRHLDFFQQLLPYYESADSIFVHAGYHHLLAMHQLDDATTYWNHLPAPLPLPHHSGKRVFVGHTPQPAGNILDAGHVVCLDTYCFGGGYLTAYEIGSNEVIQADRHGHLRRVAIRVAAGHLERMGRAILGFWRDQFGRRPDESTPQPNEPDLSRQN
jgi:serine/threonine protein phosphatase 1